VRVEHVAVSHRGQHDDVTQWESMAPVRRSRVTTPRALPVDDDQVEHLAAWMHRPPFPAAIWRPRAWYAPSSSWLPRSGARVERPLDLDAAEVAGLEQPP